MAHADSDAHQPLHVSCRLIPRCLAPASGQLFTVSWWRLREKCRSGGGKQFDQEGQGGDRPKDAVPRAVTAPRIHRHRPTGSGEDQDFARLPKRTQYTPQRNAAARKSHRKRTRQKLRKNRHQHERSDPLYTALTLRCSTIASVDLQLCVVRLPSESESAGRHVFQKPDPFILGPVLFYYPLVF